MVVAKLEDDGEQVVVRIPPLVHGRQYQDVRQDAMLNLVESRSRCGARTPGAWNSYVSRAAMVRLWPNVANTRN
jgi:hypothetical protein